MGVVITIFCILMILLAIFLVIAVLMQSGKDSRMSGTIAGGAETFFGKTKGKTIDRVLSKATTVVSIIFAALVLAVYIMQGIQSNQDISSGSGSSTGSTQNQAQETVTEEETATEEEATEEKTTGETVTAETATAE
ncbi:MAG: preprotein translocase subunit SecG [Clostridia bacterium]|nr:preprotein translocase subunit SecG [Clostridia bacterium]